MSLEAVKLYDVDNIVDLSNAVNWFLLLCLQFSCQAGIRTTTFCPTSYV